MELPMKSKVVYSVEFIFLNGNENNNKFKGNLIKEITGKNGKPTIVEVYENTFNFQSITIIFDENNCNIITAINALEERGLYFRGFRKIEKEHLKAYNQINSPRYCSLESSESDDNKKITVKLSETISRREKILRIA